MNIEQAITSYSNIKPNKELISHIDVEYFFEFAEAVITDYEKEKEKNKKAIDFINERKKIVNTDMAEGTRLQVGTFMWQVDELLEILKGIEEE